MIRLLRPDAERLAEEIRAALLPAIVKGIADLLAEQDEDGLSPRDGARIDRAAANMPRKMLGLPVDRRRKVG
jgi:hypothetical protein